MSIVGKNVISYQKQNVSSSKLLATGVKVVKFWHESPGNETSISFSALTLPNDMLLAGLSNPSSNEIISLNLKFFRNNVQIFSSLNGRLMDGLTYQLSNASLTFKNYTSAANEVFEFVFTQNAISGNTIVDARPLSVTGILPANIADFNVGTSFKVNQNVNQQVGDVTVFADGVQQFRTVDNTLNTQGNYIEVHATGGFGSIIRFKNTTAVDRSISVQATGGMIVETPSLSLMQNIETVQGQLDKVIPTVAALANKPTTDFQSAPNNVDLAAFGDGQVLNKGLIDGLQASKADKVAVETYTSLLNVQVKNTISLTALITGAGNSSPTITMLKRCKIWVNMSGRFNGGSNGIIFTMFINGIDVSATTFGANPNTGFSGAGNGYSSVIEVNEVITFNWSITDVANRNLSILLEEI